MQIASLQQNASLMEKRESAPPTEKKKRFCAAQSLRFRTSLPGDVRDTDYEDPPCARNGCPPNPRRIYKHMNHISLTSYWKICASPVIAEPTPQPIAQPTAQLATKL